MLGIKFNINIVVNLFRVLGCIYNTGRYKRAYKGTHGKCQMYFSLNQLDQFSHKFTFKNTECISDSLNSVVLYPLQTNNSFQPEILMGHSGCLPYTMPLFLCTCADIFGSYFPHSNNILLLLQMMASLDEGKRE